MADGETSYKQYLLNLCDKRGHELGKIVSDCILHAADARYHRRCNGRLHVYTQRGCDSLEPSDIDSDETLMKLLQQLTKIDTKFGI